MERTAGSHCHQTAPAGPTKSSSCEKTWRGCMESKAGLGIGGLVASVITGKNVGVQSSAVIVAFHSVQLHPMSKMRRGSVVLEAGRHHNCKNTSSRSGSRDRMGGTRRDYVITGKHCSSPSSVGLAAACLLLAMLAGDACQSAARGTEVIRLRYSLLFAWEHRC